MIPLITRIAPSPTGDMHLGTARTAYFNWLAARATGGKFILRIDDTDPERSKPEYTDVILKTMEWLGLEHDEIHYQSKRYERYRDICETHYKSLPGGERGMETAGDQPIRLFMDGMPKVWEDELAGEVKIGDDVRTYMRDTGLVIFRSPDANGVRHPTYHWASVVDDIDMGVNCIIRGVDHTSNVPKHIAIYQALGAPLPKFYHIGLIGSGGKKLSKREGAASMLQYQEKGYSPDALLNFMARLGWGPKVDDKTTSLLPREAMTKLFWEGGRMRNSFANADWAKLEWYNKKYKAGVK